MSQPRTGGVMRRRLQLRGAVSLRSSALIIIAVSLAGLTAAAVGDAQTVGAPLPFKIGWQPAPIYRMYAAQKLGYFERAGLAPTFIKFAAGPPMLAAFQTKDIDVTF